MNTSRPMLTAVVLAAGKGTRMKSDRAKVLHEICGRPLGAFAIDRALEVSADRIVIVVGHQADKVQTRLQALFHGAPLNFAYQRQQLGTGHALMTAGEAHGFGEGDVLILSGDVPLMRAETLQRLISARRETNAPVALVATHPPSPRGYGRLLRDVRGRVTRIVEEKDATAEERAVPLVNAGIYCVDASFLATAVRRLSPNNAVGEYYLTDIVADANKQGLEVVAVDAPFEETSGINDRAELASAEAVLRREIATNHMKAGVTFRDPATTYVDASVSLGADTELGPGVSLQGLTQIGTGVRVGQGSVIVDSTIADGVEIKPYSHLEGATVGAGSIIGPYARLRPGTELAEGVHIGNFVETKKTRVGRGSKANHLTYLGDAVIGQNCNIGAGTITCNYDGVHKHETRLGDGVFIGSDTQLVAPVTLENGAYVGAGTTVTKNVPADALAVSRTPMTVKPGWAAAKRQLQAAEKAAKKVGDT
jgi:bifunctional UDP-N-acetylglucosamine pyrophosphorylase/glucosamine-1-phosphate N-acetyltransferase